MTGERNIPFVVPYFDEGEANAAANAVRSCRVSATGQYGKQAEQELQNMFGCRFALLVTSCTHALELALMALDIGPGDEVIVPSFTFVSSANAILQQGAKPVFAEIREDTLNIDPEDVRRKITDRTKALVPVHYAGVACDMDALLTLAREHDLSVVEDAAQAVDSKYNDKYLGTIGTVGCYSFHDTKNVSCGEGGALLTQDERLWRQAEIMREKGTNRSAFFRGEVDKYTWVDRGSSYVLSDILATILCQQLRKVDDIRQKRQAIYSQYVDGLAALSEKGDIILPIIPDECCPNYHIFWFRTRSADERARCLSTLKKEGIGATFHYVPLHSSPFAHERWGIKKDELPVTERVGETLIRLPLHPHMTREDADHVVKAVRNLFGR